MNPLTKKKLTKIASFTCVLHCIIAPFIVMAAPTLGHAPENIWLELIALIVSLGLESGLSIVVIALTKNMRQFYLPLVPFLANKLGH